MAPPPRRPLPALRPGVAILSMDGGVELRMGDEEVHALRTDAPDRVRQALALLDGRRDREAALATLGAGQTHLLDELLGELARAGLLLPEGVTAGAGVAAYLSHSASEGHDPAAALRGARVSVVGHAASVDVVVAVLAEHELFASAISREEIANLAGEARPGGALVCACEQPDLALLFEVNDAACRAEIPCLFLDLSHGRHATVGPFYVPGEGACYRCLRARLHENTAAYDELRAAERAMLESGSPLPAFGCLPAHRHVVAGLAAGEIVAFFARHRPLRTQGRAITVALEQVELWSEPVWRVPWCEGCGPAAGRR